MLDREISVFYLEHSTDASGNELTIKHYIHPIGQHIKCSFRQLSSEELLKNRQMSSEATVQFTVNPRSITDDMYVEMTRDVYGTQTYQITAVDPYQDRGFSYYRIQGRLITAPQFDKVEGNEW